MNGLFHAGISGARGRMGRAVSQALDARDDVVVAARFDRGDQPDLSRCDVVIDFSTPEASVELAQACAAQVAGGRGGPALVIGSTGFSPDQLAEIGKAAEHWEHLKDVYAAVGVLGEIVTIYVATGLRDAGRWSTSPAASRMRSAMTAR